MGGLHAPKANHSSIAGSLYLPLPSRYPSTMNKIPEISFMVAFVTSCLSILDQKNNSDSSLRFKLALGLGSPSWWNQSGFYNPF